MRALAWLLAATTALSGCATTWAVTEVAGGHLSPEELVDEVAVPQPGLHESVRITAPLAQQYDVDPNAPAPVVTPGQIAPPPQATVPRAFQLACHTAQTGTERVHRRANRYGLVWKVGTVTSFIVEAAFATALLVGVRETGPNVAGAIVGVDALGTFALAFKAKKGVYHTEVVPTTVQLRSDCPEGLVLAIGGARFPVNAVGELGDAGMAALDAWFWAPSGPLAVELAGQSRGLFIDGEQRCTWIRTHHPDRANGCLPAYAATVTSGFVETSFDVPVGTLSHVASE